MARIKQVVLTMVDNVWRILERERTPTQSFTSNFGPEQYVWMLPHVRKGANKEKVAVAPQMPHPKMPLKVDYPVMLMSIIPMGRLTPSPDHEELSPAPRARTQGVNPTITIA